MAYSKDNMKSSGWNYNSNADSYNYEKGWWSGYGGKDNFAQWFRQFLKNNGVYSDYFDQMSDAELRSIADEYFTKSFSLLGNDHYTFDSASALKDIQNLQGYDFADYPTRPNYDQIYSDALAQIDAENSQVQSMYDNLLASQLSDLNRTYNDTTSQILSNDYIKNRQLMDTATSELSKSRRNALEAGASAGLRLANNVNTMLSMQNKQAQTSLETSNNLAQMMLNQQQAAQGIRGDYYNNTANLVRGSTERKSNYAGSQMDLQNNLYENKRNAWDETYNSKFSNNAFGESFKNYNVNKRNSYYGG